MHVALIAAGDDDLPVVQNLVSLYIYDLSVDMGWDCPESGLFGGCDELPQYWGRAPADPRYRWQSGCKGHPFLVRVDGRLAGFALVKQLAPAAPPTYEMGDFFVLRNFRRRGVGRQAAHALFDRFPGGWEVSQMAGNETAQAFWRKVIHEYTDGVFSETQGHSQTHGMSMTAQRFSTALANDT
jgi:predicted acetyltransferase